MHRNHCKKCGTKKSCGNYHVYVIELDPSVLDDKRFCPDERDSIKGQPRCFYVGQTNHTVICRYHRHKNQKKIKSNNAYRCSCDTGKEVLKPYNVYIKGSYLVKKYRLTGDGRPKSALRPDLYRHLNPVAKTREQAESAEKKLAEELRAEGFAAHYN